MRRRKASVILVAGIILVVTGCASSAPSAAESATWQAWSIAKMTPEPGDVAAMGAAPQRTAQGDDGIQSTFGAPTALAGADLECTGSDRMVFTIAVDGQEALDVGPVSVACDGGSKTVDLHGMRASAIRINATQPNGTGQWIAHVRGN
jgi:hypothetical protein